MSPDASQHGRIGLGFKVLAVTLATCLLALTTSYFIAATQNWGAAPTSSSANFGSAAPSSQSDGSSSGYTALDEKKKKKKKKKRQKNQQKQKQRKADRDNKKSRRDAEQSNNDRRNATDQIDENARRNEDQIARDNANNRRTTQAPSQVNSPSRQNAPSEQDASRRSSTANSPGSTRTDPSSTTDSRRPTWRTTPSDASVERSFGHSAETQSTDDLKHPRVVSPPENQPTALPQPRAEIWKWQSNGEVKKWGTDQANVRVLGYDAAASLQMDKDSIHAEANVEGFLVSSHQEKSFNILGPLNQKFAADEMIGGNASAALNFDPKEGADVGLDAFAGGEISLTSSQEVWGFSANERVDLRAGGGAAAQLGTHWDDGKFGLSYKLGAVWGLGGKLSGDLTIDLAEFSKHAQTFVSTKMNEIANSASGLLASARRFF